MMLDIVIFLTVFFIEISTEDKFDCTGQQDDSFHPDNDCRFYWHCVSVDTTYMRAVKRACPAGTKFDLRNNECEWANSVDCVPIKPLPITLATTTTLLPTSTRKQHRENLSLNIFISAERRIRRFPIYSASGILIHCNEIRRRQLRDLIFRPLTRPTIIRNYSSKIFPSAILSLTILLIFTKISD